MAKLTSLIKFGGTFDGVTTVRSRAYGQHIRRARTSFTLGKEMKESAVLIKEANVYAKAFQDSIDPYRRDFRDGQLWPRLVSLFKTQIRKKGSADFSILEGHELNKRHPLSDLFTTETTVVQAEKMLNVEVISRYCYSKDLTRSRADGYEQTLIILFADNATKFRSFSKSEHISLKAEAGEQQASFTIPEGATTAVIVMLCNLSSGNRALTYQTGMGMRVEKVVKCS